MKIVYKLCLSTLALVFFLSQSVTKVEAAACNWKSRNASTKFWDSCKTSKGSKLALNGSISFSNSACLKYEWTVNGNSAGNSVSMNYPVLMNGSYNVCVRVIDTCNSCDTTFCVNREFTCAPKTYCNFKSRGPFTFFWDSCNGKKSKLLLNAYVKFNSFYCLGYEWTVNGKPAGKGWLISYPVTKNGTYNVCVRVKDTCSNCDTTICQNWTFYCSNAVCNWKARNPVFKVKDTCTVKDKSYNLRGSLDINGNKTCYRYNWIVAGNDAGFKNTMTYTLNDGNWYVCLKVQDTCASCDTTFCNYTKVNCNGQSGSVNTFTEKLLKVYPNPTDGILKLEWKEEKGIYSLYNMKGQLVQSGHLTEGIHTIELNTYPKGIYLLRVKGVNSTFTERISVIGQ